MLSLIELFINATILIAFISLGNQLFREKVSKRFSVRHRNVLVGFSSGILGCLLMIYGVPITSDFFLDFRIIPIILSAIYFSLTSSFIATLIIGVFQMAYFGLNQASVLGFGVELLIGLGCGLIGKIQFKNLIKWCLAIPYVYLINGIFYLIILKNSPMLNEVLTLFFIGTALLSLVMYYFTKHLAVSNQLYRFPS